MREDRPGVQYPWAGARAVGAMVTQVSALRPLGSKLVTALVTDSCNAAVHRAAGLMPY
jgi:hypothetical protein